MDALASQFLLLLERLTGGPRSPIDSWVMRCAGAVGLLAGFRLAIEFSGATRIETGRLLVALLAGILTPLGASAAMTAYLPSPWHDAIASGIVIPLVPVAALMLVGIPAQCRMLHGQYVPMLIAFVTSLACAAMLLLAAGAVLHSVETGRERSACLVERRHSTERFINQE